MLSHSERFRTKISNNMTKMFQTMEHGMMIKTPPAENAAPRHLFQSKNEYPIIRPSGKGPDLQMGALSHGNASHR